MVIHMGEVDSRVSSRVCGAASGQREVRRETGEAGCSKVAWETRARGAKHVERSKVTRKFRKVVASLSER